MKNSHYPTNCIHLISLRFLISSYYLKDYETKIQCNLISIKSMNMKYCMINARNIQLRHYKEDFYCILWNQKQEHDDCYDPMNKYNFSCFFLLIIRFLEVSAIYCFVENPKPLETQYYSLNEILTNQQLYHQKSIDLYIESFFIAVNVYGYIHSISRIYTMNRTSYYILVELAPSSQDEQDDSFFYIRIHHLPLILQLYTFCNICDCIQLSHLHKKKYTHCSFFIHRFQYDQYQQRIYITTDQTVMTRKQVPSSWTPFQYYPSLWMI